ncbi:MAG: AAA family ATPase [Rhodobacter sp.]|nr:AAA family ATPase [Rhodobacter sp.]
MRLREIRIKNFKAIDDTTLVLKDFSLIVGTNGSGKSSVLQALHWMFQSGRNPSIAATRDKSKGATLSEKDATFMPTPDYRNAGHGIEYGNKLGTPQLDLLIEAVEGVDTEVSAEMWIKSARNEGITVHVPSANAITAAVRDQTREFSAYIPGLAGIPLTEEKRSKLIVQRLAAAGDANTVLRNVLDLLRGIEVEGRDGLAVVQEYVSRIMGGFAIEVDFDDNKHARILARFQTQEMKAVDGKRFKPLELAGIGFLQVIQIFAYLVYFRPVLLLVDEPDAHLHPMAQDRLVTVLAEAAEHFGTQIIMTTHSPSVVRALPSEACVIWMKDGKVQPDDDTRARNLMGWGLLDRRILLMTEDANSSMLRAILAQWPDLERITAIWPYHGAGKLPPAETIRGLGNLLGDHMKIVIHRDRDFMMPEEVDALQEPYKDRGMQLWITRCSDIESYWAENCIIASHFSIDLKKAELILKNAVNAASADDAAVIKRRMKRIEATQKIENAKKGAIRQFGDKEVEAEAQLHGFQHAVLGKILATEIRKAAQFEKMGNTSSFGKKVPSGLQISIADDLQVLLKEQAH